METDLILTTVGLIGLLIFIVGSIMENNCIITIGITTIIVVILIAWAIGEKPSAMDVYQGKTTLEYTYRDGVAIDSVVVFKDNVK